VIGLILAAGYGTRLKPFTLEKPKTLFELEPGVSILDYIVGTLREVGVKEVYVVTRSDLEAFFSGRSDVKVLVVDVAEGDGNLWTLHQAVEALRKLGLEDDILLSMSDHIYEFNLVKKLIKTAFTDMSKVYLCLDRRARGRDAVEGLKILVDDQYVILSGKNIPPYSGVDTGVFFIPRTLLSHISEVVSEKGRKATLADFVNALARVNLVSFVDVSGLLWQDIDTVEDLVKARRLYWKILRRNLVKDTDGVISRYVNRKFSTLISLTMYKHRIFVHPNIITLLVAIVGIAASALIFTGHIYLGALLALLSSLLDGVDGELARLYRVQSLFGALLDNILDRVVDTLIMTALFYRLVVETRGLMYSQTLFEVLVVFTLSLLGSVLVSYVSNALHGKEYIARIRNSFPWATRDVRIFVFSIAIFFRAYAYALLYVGIASWWFIIRAVLHSLKGEDPVTRRFISRFKLPPITPRIAKPYSILLEEILVYLLFLTVLSFLAGLAIDNALYYSESSQLYIYTLVWQLIAIVEITLLVYLSVNFVKALATLFNALKDYVIERLWVTPLVYAQLAKRLLLLIITLLARFPLNYAMTLARISKEITELCNYLITVIALVILVLLIVDAVRTFEHIIQRYLKIPWK
jgi:choline kinase/phosphatidylglycerophosphate synthase